MMSTASCYRNYSDIVKVEVARTGNVYLFPDLRIPRTTAQYWVKKQFHKYTSDEIDSIYKQKSELLANELAKEKAIRELLETVRKVFPYDFSKKQLKNKLARAQIIAAIREALKYHKLSHCLNAIGLSKSAYQRWSSEISFCKRTNSPCERRQALQLTSDEVELMKKFVTSKKYAHISIASLQLLAQRRGELFCSPHTWYKYIRNYEWTRPWTLEKREVFKTGIRASKPNELWHIDVTVLNVRPGYKLYIQAVIDNFSRYVLVWQVTDEINAKNTVETLNRAKLKASALLNSDDASNVMMDPGTENRNGKVLQCISSKNLTRTLARVDIHYSNSMIERLFLSLKNQYLYHQKIDDIKDLLRMANFYFRQHNEVIPLAVHKGGTPSEIFLSKWREIERSELQVNKEQAIMQRKWKNLQPSCGACPI